jgi:cell division septum initiation protein DivIVA
LWPGIGERMVQAQEERVRAAAAEVQRLEEAARQQEQEAQQAQEDEDKAASEEKAEIKHEDGPSEGPISEKGKERADVAVETEAPFS